MKCRACNHLPQVVKALSGLIYWKSISPPRYQLLLQRRHGKGHSGTSWYTTISSVILPYMSTGFFFERNKRYSKQQCKKP